VSTFYLLPSRPLLGERVATFLNLAFPGSEWPSACWTGLADVLSELATMHEDVFVVYSEDLPAGMDTDHALADVFGAEPGDWVIEVRAESCEAAPPARRWQMGAKEAQAA